VGSALGQGVILLADQLVDFRFFLLAPLGLPVDALAEGVHAILHFLHHLHLQLHLHPLRIRHPRLPLLNAVGRVSRLLLQPPHFRLPHRLPSRLPILLQSTHDLRPGQDKTYFFHEVEADGLQGVSCLCEFDVEGDEVVEQLLSEVVGVEELLELQHLLHLPVTQR
jgi:hypothetical protein